MSISVSALAAPSNNGRKSAKKKTPAPTSTPVERKAVVLIEPKVSSQTAKAPGPLPRAEYVEFSKILLKAMLRKKLSQSDLAREIWGTVKDHRGYDVARNRDRITDYIKGRAYPEPKNLKALADALDMPIEALQIDRPSKGVARISNGATHDVQIHFLATEPDKSLLIVQKLVSTKLALEIANLLREELQSEEEGKAADAEP